LLTDPFYKPDVKYSSTSTGIRDLEYGTSYVAAGLALVGLLQDAGWEIVDSGPSSGTALRAAFYLQTVSGLGTPVDMTAAQCTSLAGAPWRRASAGGVTYNSYDPGQLTPVCPGGTNGIVWFEAGTTSLATATSLAEKISLSLLWSAAVTATIGDPSAGGSYQFTFTSRAPAFEFDEYSILDGNGTMKRGFYTLRSPLLDGSYLECKIETRVTNNSGGFFIYDGIGTVKLFLTITASGGGSYTMPFMPGSYHFCGNHHQFVIWPKVGQVVWRNANTSIFASLIEAPAEHLTAGNCPLVIGSNNGDLGTNPDHLRNLLHWSQSLASGHASTMDDTQYRKGNCDGYLKVAMIVRGTKGRPTTSLAGQPLVQAAYVALPANPTSGPGPQVVGKLWDIVLTSGNAALGKSMMHDGKKWTCFSTTAAASDVGCDMWILTGAST
jgi:hypothetical protein